jgi:uncharacterized protein involved in oxidation of intracellular sulfur
MKVLLTLNDAPYGTERTYNGLRLAGTLTRKEGVEVKVFLVGDAASSAKKGQKVPQGFYNVETMIGSVVRHGGKVGVCGTCMDARGLTEAELTTGTQRSSLEEWATWTAEADKCLVF